MLIYLLRHGLTNYNVEKRYQGMWGESELTELGIAQAKEVGEHLSPVPFDRFYVSGAMRAAQTASYAFPTRTEEFIYRDDLREIHTGELTNQLLADCMLAYGERMKMIKGNEDYAEFGGESSADVQARAALVAKDILGGGGECVCIVSHGAFIRFLTEAFTGIPYAALSLYRNCAYSVIRFDGGRCTLELHNATARDNLLYPEEKKAGAV